MTKLEKQCLKKELVECLQETLYKLRGIDLVYDCVDNELVLKLKRILTQMEEL